MTDPATWWTHRDARRIISRAHHLGGIGTLEEISYLKQMAMSVLVSPLPIHPDDATALRHLVAQLEHAHPIDDEQPAA